MRRALLTGVMVGGLVGGSVVAAAPATAAPARTDSGTFSQLFSRSEDCAAAGTRTVCDAVSLDVYQFSGDQVEVCLTFERYAISSSGRFTSLSTETGCSLAPASAFTVTSTLSATLAPTDVTVGNQQCNRRGCTTSGERVVTVSAADTASGPIGTSTNRGTFTDGTCKIRYSSTSTSAPVSGTMTIDGTTLQQTGFAALDEFRVLARDCPEFP